MVKKCSKAGLHTGNTIRLPGGHPFLQKYQKYSYFVADGTSLDRDQKRQLRDLTTYLPTSDGHVEYSMNKKKRWELPKLIQAKLINESDNPHLQMVVTEHVQGVGDTEDEHRKFCSAYYTNNGPVLEKKSHSEMNMKSAMQSYIETDHLTRKERRQLHREMLLQEFEPIAENTPVTPPSYSCHIIHGAPTNGKLFKDLTTKGVLMTRSSKRFRSFGFSKLDHKTRITDDDKDITLDFFNDELEDTLQEPTTPRDVNIPLTDLIVNHKKHHRKVKKDRDYVLISKHGL